MKVYIGVDSKTRLIHAVTAIAANVRDNQAVGNLLHGAETRVWGDTAYQGQHAVIRERPPVP